MSSFAISLVTPSNATQIGATARTGPAQANPTPAPEEDTVQLSEGAQAEALHQSGESVSAIASSLRASVSTVDSYLGIATTIAVPLTVGPAAHAAPAAKAAPAAPADAPMVAVKG